MWLSPQQYYDVYKDTFDYLHQHEPMSLLVMTVHCHFGGRPLMSAVLNRDFSPRDHSETGEKR